MRKVIVVFAILLLAIVVGMGYGQGSHDSPRTTLANRYQLIAARANYEATDGTTREGSEVFLLDSETGRIWQYEPYLAAETNGKPDLNKAPIHKAHFEVVAVDKLSQ